MKIDEARVIARRDSTHEYSLYEYSYLILEKLGSDYFRLDIRINNGANDRICPKGRLIDGGNFWREEGPFPEVMFESPHQDKVEKWLKKVGWMDYDILEYICKKCDET